jgi:hypothetical protein
MIPIYLLKTKKWHIQTDKGLLDQSFYSLQEAFEYINGHKIRVSVWR